MHLVMPWFLPLAALTAWLGTRAARSLHAEGGASRRAAAWMLLLMWVPLFFWLVTQIASRSGLSQ
jgi:hypothetical protein